MKDAKVVRKFRSQNDDCVVWKSAKAMRKVCTPRGLQVVKKFTNKQGAKCTVIQNGNKRMTRCRGVGTITRPQKTFTKNGKTCTTFKRGARTFTRCKTVRRFVIRGAKVLRRWRAGKKSCTQYQRGSRKFTRCILRKASTGRVIRVFMR
jgi:hypothetical protein